MATATPPPGQRPGRDFWDPANGAGYWAGTEHDKSQKNGRSNGVPSQGGGTGRAKPHAEALLPDPEFTSPASIRNYCNQLRALMTGVSFELAMASEILKGTLGAVPDPDGRPFGSRQRAARVSRKLMKSADAAKAAAVNAAATYAKFAQEYEEEINRVRHRARRSTPARRIDWADQ
ncbi:plasmid transfer protein TraA [Streptomyces pini]|uniref:Sporulation protein SsgA n=1 Tax=Streptomyces pini TaxID=1520580 RepID=A0A1I4MDZ3_9ACTN|nr:plasmid transfer protein TraA [Streptomyces pini]SFM01429.1 hypothetical protein SAMN05192584_1402 [Streptomyces pini]